MHKSWTILLLILLGGCGWKPYKVCGISWEGEESCSYYLSEKSYDAWRKKGWEKLKKTAGTFPDDYRDIAVMVIADHLSGETPEGIKEKYFVSVFDEDVDSIVINKLLGAGVVAEPASKYAETHFELDSAGLLVSNIRISISAIERLDDGSYRVGIGYYCGVLCAGSWSYKLKKEQERWVVMSRQPLIFS